MSQSFDHCSPEEKQTRTGKLRTKAEIQAALEAMPFDAGHLISSANGLVDSVGLDGAPVKKREFPVEEEITSFRRDWPAIGAAGLERAYSEQEPEYTPAMLKETNPNYKAK